MESMVWNIARRPVYTPHLVSFKAACGKSKNLPAQTPKNCRFAKGCAKLLTPSCVKVTEARYARVRWGTPRYAKIRWAALR